MSSSDDQFEQELEVFRTESEGAMQFFYAYLTVHAAAAEQESLSRVLNTAPLFWNTILGALQTAGFMALGRIFDQDSDHNLDRLLRIAQDCPSIFSEASLGIRKQGGSRTPPDWLTDFLRDIYVPTADDFRRLRRHVESHRKTYKEHFRDIRHKLFAHKGVSARADIDALFAKTNIEELQRLLTFLGSLYEALRELFINGEEPVLRPRSCSAMNIRQSPSYAGSTGGIEERITRETEQFLQSLARAPKQDLADNEQEAGRRDKYNHHGAEMNDELRRLPEIVRALYALVSELENIVPGRKFTPDGIMVGSLGEVWAASTYNLTLLPNSTPVHDARDSDGRCVQVKTTQRDSVSTYDEQPEHLLVLKLLRDGTFEEWFNGPGHIAWRVLGKKAKNGQCRLSLSRLRTLMREVPGKSRIPKL